MTWQVVVAEFDNLPESLHKYHGHAKVVGVHGMGGIGKTLLCKALCNVYHAEFSGRVLHVELKGHKDFKQENIIEVQKLILEALTDAGPELVKKISSVEQVSTTSAGSSQSYNFFDLKLPKLHVF